MIAEIIKGRRSIRRFSAKEVEDGLVRELIEMACWAPSAGNLQSWFFYIVKNKDLREKLARAALNQSFIAQAPVVIVACCDLARISWYGERGRNLYCIMDVAMALQNLMLYAHFRGLGTCCVGAFHEDEVREILNIPEDLRPIALIPLGYPAEKPDAPKRRSVEEVTSWIE